MKTVSVDFPDNLAQQVADYVKAGFFLSEPDVILAAISEFVRRSRLYLMERLPAKTSLGRKKRHMCPIENTCLERRSYHPSL